MTSVSPKGRVLSAVDVVVCRVLIAVVAVIVSFTAAEVVLRTLHPCPRYGYELLSAQRVFLSTTQFLDGADGPAFTQRSPVKTSASRQPIMLLAIEAPRFQAFLERPISSQLAIHTRGGGELRIGMYSPSA